jgi:Spy/CpxP family protein refolding chaperone
MNKRTIFAGTLAAVLVTGIAVVDAQGRRGPAGQQGGRPGVQGQMMGPRGGQMLGAPGRGFGGRMGPGRPGGRRGGGPLAGLRDVGLTEDQKTKVKAILDEVRAERLAARTKTENAILALLTAEQKAKLGRK